MIATKLECHDCGGTLVQRDGFYVCEYCGTKWALSQDYDGNTLFYHPVEKREIECGKIAPRAAQIQVNQITVKEIKLKDTVEADVERESRNLGRRENLRLIATFLANQEWVAAQEQVDQLLAANPADSEAQWCAMSCQRHARNSQALVSTFSALTDADAAKLDQIIQNATPKFAKYILDLLLKNGYVGDAATAKLLAICLPYLRNQALYSPEEYQEKIQFAFRTVIDRKDCKSFEYLLSNALNPEDVDRYIEYLEQFADRCSPQQSQKYLSMIIAVDPGNVPTHRRLVIADLKGNAAAEKCIADFEALVTYSGNPTAEVEKLITALAGQTNTTKAKSDFFWALLGYHPNAPECFKEELLRYASQLRQSELWEESRRFLNLVLSFDARNPDAYYGLCMVRMKAKNREELISQKEDLINCPELRKAIALYQSAGNDKAAKILMDYTQEQKKKKKNKAMGLTITAISLTIAITLLSLIVGISVWSRSRKYNERNIQMTVTDKAYPKDTGPTVPCHFMLDIQVKNGSSLDVSRIDGIIRFYDDEDRLLHQADVWLSGNLESGEEYDYEFEVKEDPTESTVALHQTPLHRLKITWELTEVTYTRKKAKEYHSEKEHVIHKIRKNPKELSSQEIADQELQNKLTDILATFDRAPDAGDLTNPDLETAYNALYEILETQHSDRLYGPCFEQVYRVALSYQENSAFGKGYMLFDLLGYYGYQDAQARSAQCADYFDFTTAMAAIEETGEDSPSFPASLNTPLRILSELYMVSEEAETFKQSAYEAALRYKQEGQYRKAYYLFYDLSYEGYADANQQAQECKNLMEN